VDDADVSGSMLKGCADRGALTAVPVVLVKLNARVSSGYLLQYLPRTIIAAVVYHDEFQSRDEIAL
jgi:hypothetical protein